MSLLHYFNPGHEASVLLGTASYTPPANVQRMQRELACLPAWYADPDDYVWVGEAMDTRFFASFPAEWQPFAEVLSADDLKNGQEVLPRLQAMPWGLSPQSVRLFAGLHAQGQAGIEAPVWKEEFVFLTSRRAAAACLEKLQSLLPAKDLPAVPRFCTELKEIEMYLRLRNAPFVVKTPFSSSGRGLLWIGKRQLTEKEKRWIEGAMCKQGAVSIECGLDKVQDFALEFYSDGEGHVRYEGISLFATEEKGAYTGNVLQSQAVLHDRIAGYTGAEMLEETREALIQVLKEMYGSVYRGYLGVDMLVYRRSDGNFAIHPCVEINMRYTMGMAALRLFQKYVHPAAQGDFRVAYEGKAGEAYEQHTFMEKVYPLRVDKGRIVEGYLSLCPVTRDTRYRAYLLVV